MDEGSRAGLSQGGNILLSSILGADLYTDAIERPIGDKGSLDDLAEYLRLRGQKPYVIPGGGSDHRLGGFGYVVCAAEIVAQSASLGIFTSTFLSTPRVVVVKRKRFERGSRVLLLHLGGTPAVHAYANQFGSVDLAQFPI